MAPPHAMNPGSIFDGRYVLEAAIGRGGMGRIFRARDVTSGDIVALKVLNRTDADPTLAERFKQEISILSRISHPAVPAILDWGAAGDALYFAAEFIDGVNLKSENARRGRWPAPEAAALAAVVADALAAAHALGIVHRDVNANNIMIARGLGAGRSADADRLTSAASRVAERPDVAKAAGVRLIDFGIARSVDVDVTRITTTGTIVGTPAYMAPEQFESRPVDARTDIYSLGVVLFEMVTGRLPFTGDTPVNLALQHRTETVPSPRAIASEVPMWVERIVLKCLDKNPGRRFGTAAALARELSQARPDRGPRRRRLPSGDVVVEDLQDQSDWALVLSAAKPKSGWSPGMALRFEDRFYQLARIDEPPDRAARWTYSFVHWPESVVFRGVVDYDQDCAARHAAEAATLRGRLTRWLGH